MKQEVKQGQTDYTVLILIRDTDGAPKTGLVFNSAGIDVGYSRVEIDNDIAWTDGAPVDLATPLLTDPHLDWGFLQVDATKAPGVYRLDLPDGVFASGAWSAIVSLICTGCDPTHIEFVLVPEAPYTGVNVSQWLGQACAAVTNNGVPEVDITHAGGVATDLSGTPTSVDAILTDTGTTLDTLVKDIPTTAELALRTLLAADYTVVGDLGTVQTGDSYAYISGAPASIDAILTDTGTDGVAIADGLLTAAKFAANCLTAAKIDTDVHAECADAVWDEVLTGAVHNAATSAGRRLRQAVDALILREETCQAGAGNDEVQFDVGASAVNNFYANDIVILTAGTGVGQSRHIDSYVGGTTTATVNRDWTTNPDATTEYVIRADSTKHVHGFETAALDEIWDHTEGVTGDGHTFESIIVRMYRYLMNKLNITDATGAVALRNEADGADIATQGITDAAGTTTRTKVTWV